MPKPPFNPNQPYEVDKSKPAFDPSQPHEVVKEADRPVPQGFGDKVNSALSTANDFVSALAPRVPVLQSGMEYLGDLAFSKDQKDFEKRREETVSKNDRIRQEYPTASMYGDLSGSMLIPGAKAFEAAKDAGLAAKAGWGLANSASRVGYGVAQSSADAALTGKDTGEAAELSTKWGAGLEGLGILGRGIRKVAGPAFFGVKPATEAAYKARPAAINEITEEAASDTLTSRVQKLKDAEINSMEGLSKAKETAAAKGQELKEEASQAIDRSYKEGKQKIAEFNKAKIPTLDQAESVLASAKEMRGAISKKSGEAFDALNASDITISTKRIKTIATQKINESKVAGQDLAITGNDYEIMKSLRDDLEKLPKDMRPEDMKRLVQAIDSKIEEAYAKVASGAGYITRGERALMDIRRAINEDLITIPQYKQIMGDVAEKTRALEDFNKFYSNPGTALRSMKAAQRGGNDATLQLRALQKFDELHGTDYASKLQQGTQTAESGVAGTAAQQEAYEAAWKKRIADQKLQSDNILGVAENDLASARANLSPVKGISEANAQSYMRAAGAEGRPNINRLRTLDYLDEMRGTGEPALRQMADDVAVKRAFEKGFTNGSRNVNLGALSVGGVGGAIASKLGAGSGATGLMSTIGAVAGALADTVGPKTYKKILDIEMNPNMKRAAFALKQAAQRSPQSVILTHRLLRKQDPAYRAYTSGEDNGSK